MKTLDFSLGPDNLKDIPFNKYEKNFTFIINGKKHETSRFIADLFSPYVRKMHFIDETINKFYINNNELNDECFEEFLKLSSFNNFQLNSKERKLYSEYFYHLGNIEEYYRIQPECYGVLTTENAVERLISILNNSLKNTDEIDRCNINFTKIIEFISIHFEEIDKELVKKLPIDTIEEILMSDSLIVEDEDSLMRFVLSLYEDDQKYSVLFEYVLFCNVSERLLKSFISQFDLQLINQRIWGKICSRLLRSTIQINRTNSRYCKPIENLNGIEFIPSTGKELKGIMRFLTDKTNGNIHENKAIEITSNSIHSGYHPKSIVDYHKSNFYHSKNEEDSFVCFDFKDKLIQLSSYSIKSHNSGKNCGNLRNWIIEISKNGVDWIEIDRHENENALNGSKIVSNFQIKNQNNEFCRFIRIKQIGCSWSGFPNAKNYYVIFDNVEFFGILRLPQNFEYYSKS